MLHTIEDDILDGKLIFEPEKSNGAIYDPEHEIEISNGLIYDPEHEVEISNGLIYEPEPEVEYNWLMIGGIANGVIIILALIFIIFKKMI